MTTAGQGEARTPIPLPAALAAFAVLLIGGALVIWKYVYRPAKPPNVTNVRVPAPGNPRVAGGDDAMNDQLKQDVTKTAAEADLPDGIHARGNNDALVKGGDVYMRVLPREAQPPGFTFGYFTLADREWEHGYVTQGVRRILAQEDYALELAITTDQAKRLQELPDAPASKWPEADRKRFADAYMAWAKAADAEKGKLSEDLVRGLKEFGEKRRWGDQQVMNARLAQVKEILNERQLNRINPIPRWELQGAAQKATTKPGGKP